jgi:hypothetical protein
MNSKLNPTHEQEPRSATVTNLGFFEGFNFREQSAIERTLSAEEVIQWNHDARGEAEFWPSGSHPGVSLLFSNRRAVHASELVALHRILKKLGDDSILNFLRLHFVVNVLGMALNQVNAETLADPIAMTLHGSSLFDLRKEAAYELFETYFPALHKAWDDCPMDGLRFDTDDFLDSPMWNVEEVELCDGSKGLIVASA